MSSIHGDLLPTGCSDLLAGWFLSPLVFIPPTGYTPSPKLPFLFNKKALFNNIYFDSDLVLRMQSTIISGKKIGLCTQGIFYLKNLLIVFVIQNLNQIYISIPEILKTIWKQKKCKKISIKNLIKKTLGSTDSSKWLHFFLNKKALFHEALFVFV